MAGAQVHLRSCMFTYHDKRSHQNSKYAFKVIGLSIKLSSKFSTCIHATSKPSNCLPFITAHNYFTAMSENFAFRTLSLSRYGGRIQNQAEKQANVVADDYDPYESTKRSTETKSLGLASSTELASILDSKSRA